MSEDLRFDPETGRFYRDMTDVFLSDPLPEDPVDNEFVPPQPEDDAFEFTPGGSDGETLSPPQTFYVAEDGQNVRVNPDGSVAVDIIIEIDDEGSEYEYEVRVTT